MRNLYDYADMCVKELNAVGIYPNCISGWKINYRAKSRWGQCSKINGKYYIQISYCLLDESISDKGLKETILHELLHAVNGCMNHGDKWTTLANKVNNYYGYGIKRTNSYEDKGFEINPLERVCNYKYKIICNSCDREWKYQRASKVISACRENRVSCPYCNIHSLVVIDI